MQDVYIGKLEKCELLNYLITLAKLHIWQSRKQDKIPECEVFLKQVDVKYRTEKYIAVKNNTQKQFQAKWLLYRWHKLPTSPYFSCELFHLPYFEE